jgi:FkbM family methyltransferase
MVYRSVKAPFASSARAPCGIVRSATRSEEGLMAWKESWGMKLRRRFRKPFNRIVHGKRYFITQYRGADFLLRPDGIGSLEVSAKIAERCELINFMNRCADLKPDIFLDIGANIGLYSCILLRNASVPRAILFEPDQLNLVQLKANLLINGLINLVEVHEVALGDAAASHRLVPGAIDGGFSRIVEGISPDGEGYEVQVATLDNLLSLSDRSLAIKIDVEHYECKVLAGMKRTLQQNRCIVQIEAFETRDQVVAMMTAEGYKFVGEFSPNFVFENFNK